MGQSKPIEMRMSEDVKKRHNMFLNSLERLQHFAFRAKTIHGLDNRSAVVICIVVDSIWRDLVDAIMPDTDWQIIRDQGLVPIAHGFQRFNVCEYVATKVPDLERELMGPPEEGYYRCLVLDDNGCSIYYIVPDEQVENINRRENQ